MNRVYASLLALAVLSLPSMSHAAPRIATVSVQGIVIDADRHMPLAGVVVSLVIENRADRKSAVTSKSGAFAFKGLESGKYLISFQKAGYDVATLADVKVDRGEAVTLNPPLVLHKSKFAIRDYPVHPGPCGSLVQPGHGRRVRGLRR